MTNEEVTEIDQLSTESGPALMPLDDGKPLPWRAWYAKVGSKNYAAVFNLSDQSRSVDVPWLSFHVTEKSHAAYDVWNKRPVPKAEGIARGAAAPWLRAVAGGIKQGTGIRAASRRRPLLLAGAVRMRASASPLQCAKIIFLPGMQAP